MKVLAITPDFPGPDSATAGVFVFDQLNGLSIHADVTVAHLRSDFGPAPRRWFRRTYWWYRRRSRDWHDDPRVPVQRVMFRRSGRPDEDVVPAMVEAVLDAIAISGRAVDIVYAHWLWPGGSVGLEVARRLGVPLAAIARGGDLHAWLDKPHVRRRAVEVIDGADLLLANSNYLRERMDAIVPGGSARCEVVYNGVDTEAFSPASGVDRRALRSSLGLGDGDRVLLCVGPVSERKGHLELAEAWMSIHARFPNWVLVLVGAPAEDHVVRAVQNLPAVRMVGAISRPDVVDWMRAADLAVQPSRSEGLANTTLEALAVGCPVVSTDTSAQPEIVIDGLTGRLVPTGDVDALAAALDDLMGDEPTRAQLSSSARTFVVDRFDSRSHHARLARVLGGALPGRPIVDGGG